MPDLGNTSVFSQTDSSNNTGTQPSWSGSAAPSTIDDAGRALQGAVFREWNWRNFTVSTTGSSNAYVATFSVAPAALYNGQRFGLIASFANTGTATLNINSLGAKTIKKVVAGTKTALSSGDIASGAFIEVAYNTSDDSFIWVNRGEIPTSFYSPSGTDVALADGGTGASLTDPNADRILFWDDSGTTVTWLTAGSGLAISGTTMTVDIGGLSEDTSPDNSADFVMTLDATDSTLKKVKPVNIVGTPGGATVLLDAVSLGSSASYVVSSSTITQAYKRFEIIIEGASHNSAGTSQTLLFEISGNNGTGYSSTYIVSSSQAGSGSITQMLEIYNASVTTGTRIIKATGITQGVDGLTTRSVTTGYINAMRFTWASAASFDAGTITLIGYK